MRFTEIIDKLKDEFEFAPLNRVILGLTLKTEKKTNKKYAEAKIIVPKHINDLRDITHEDKGEWMYFIGLLPKKKALELMDKGEKEADAK